MFGTLVLQDGNSAKVDAIIKKHMKDSDDINMEIFQLWLSGAGLQPVSWKTLVDVLNDIELHVLAGKISNKYNVSTS